MGARKKILIVDDEKINLDFFEVMLCKLGFTVDKAYNGQEAIERVRRFYPDLILLDNIMPRMSGWEVTKSLKSDPKYRDIPIIMLSALNDVKDKIEGFELGIEDYITKPFNFSEVLARIRAALRNRELVQEIEARESQLLMVENFTESIKDTIQRFIPRLNDLGGAVSKLSSQNEGEGAEALRYLGEGLQNMRDQMVLLDARLADALEEWEYIRDGSPGIHDLQDKIHTMMKMKIEGSQNGEGF